MCSNQDLGGGRRLKLYTKGPARARRLNTARINYPGCFGTAHCTRQGGIVGVIFRFGQNKRQKHQKPKPGVARHRNEKRFDEMRVFHHNRIPGQTPSA